MLKYHRLQKTKNYKREYRNKAKLYRATTKIHRSKFGKSIRRKRNRKTKYIFTNNNNNSCKKIYRKIQKQLHPTELGRIVNKLLIENFGDVINVEFTAQMEEEFDKIAEGKENWKK